jgi:type II secretory pathway predicted ATPase ExeA
MVPQSKPVFFYEGAGRSKILSQIHHCLRFSPGVIVLTGSTGSGRSLMIDALVHSCIKNETELCLLSEDCAVLETEEELFRALAQGFELEEKPIEIVEDLVDRVQHFIETGLQSNHIMLIVVDDVRQHSDAVRAALLQLVHSTKKLSLLLVGEAALFETVKQSCMQSISIRHITLRPLLAEEALDFLHQYISGRGFAIDSVLSQHKPDELMSKTGGNLALLVREAQQLLAGTQIHRSHTYKNFPVVHIVALVAVIITTTLAFWYYPASTYVNGKEAAPEKITNTVLPVTSSETSSSDTIELSTNSDASQEIKIAIEPSRTQQSNVIQLDEVYTRREQELLDRPSDHVTLQVLSLSSEQKAKNYIDQSALVDKSALSYYRRGSESSDSFVVLYGDYPDKQRALQAQKMLPDELKKSAPWPRSMADIQQELRRRPKAEF